MATKSSVSCRPLAERVRQMRQDAGLTIEGAAEAAGLERSDWSYFEYMRTQPPPVPVLRRILGAVGCSEREALSLLMQEGLL